MHMNILRDVQYRERYAKKRETAFEAAPFTRALSKWARVRRSVSKWARVCMRALPLGPSVELPMGVRNVRGVCQSVPEYACGPCHWGLRWSSLWGHETCEGCAKVEGGRHARSATGAFGGAPCGVTKRVRGVPKSGWNRMRTLPPGPSVELPMGPRTV